MTYTVSWVLGRRFCLYAKLYFNRWLMSTPSYIYILYPPYSLHTLPHYIFAATLLFFASAVRPPIADEAPRRPPSLSARPPRLRRRICRRALPPASEEGLSLPPRLRRFVAIDCHRPPPPFMMNQKSRPIWCLPLLMYSNPIHHVYSSSPLPSLDIFIYLILLDGIGQIVCPLVVQY